MFRKIALIALPLGLAACGGAGGDSAGASRDQIKVVGSSTVYPFTKAVAEQFASKNSQFKAPVVESTGTGSGMKLFCAGIGVQRAGVGVGVDLDDRRSDLDRHPWFGQQFVNPAGVWRRQLNRRLGGLDLRDHVAGPAGAPPLPAPLGASALLHGRRQGRHKDVGHSAASLNSPAARRLGAASAISAPTSRSWMKPGKRSCQSAISCM